MLNLDAIRERESKATKGPWRSMREGNQYVEARYLPCIKLVGASRIDGIQRPWNPYAYVQFGMKAETHEVARFIDEDADFIANARQDIPDLLAEIDRLNADVERLKGIKPELGLLPPDIGDGSIRRYGIKWNGPQQPLALPMGDGYWTPWHIATEEIGRLNGLVEEAKILLITITRLAEGIPDATAIEAKAWLGKVGK